MKQLTPALRALLVALVATVMVVFLRSVVLIPIFGFGNRVVPFFVAVVAATWIDGLSAGVLATLFGLIASIVLSMADRGWDQALPKNLPSRLVAFVVISGLVSWLIGALRADRRRIAASESRMRGILDNSPAVISLKDLHGRYVLVNRGWEELFGVANEQVIGLTNEELLSKGLSPRMSRSIADQFLAVDQHVIQSGKAIEFEDPMPWGNDQRVFTTVKFPIKDACEEAIGIGGISIDISERREAMDSFAAEQEMLRHTIEFQDQERELVAYEIHDGLVQYATGALMQLEGIRHQLQSEEDSKQIERVVEILRRTVTEGRRLVNGIRTPVLDDWGVVAAVEQLIGEPDQAHLEIQFIKDQALGRLAPRLEETLYRIAQEALTNVRKHSQSKKVHIELARRGDRIHLAIRDWGVGFMPSQNGAGTSGLNGMRNRARIAGGQCDIKSVPDEGTRILIDLPLLNRS